MRKSLVSLTIGYILSFQVHSLGLGELTVFSHLNEPFSAEIELFDIPQPLSAIQSQLATPEEFERMQLPREQVLADITMEVAKNKAGKPIIRLTSLKRITEPYFELLVDVIWPTGELYRAYSILLDPPNYLLNKPTQGALFHALPTAIFQKDEHPWMSQHSAEETPQETTYGPTLVNETIEQIARRYLTNNLTLNQVILALLGKNPNAFVGENLNGLKLASRLLIPTEAEMAAISPVLAAQEVQAQDLAWKQHTAISHVLVPPYLTGHESTTSVIPSIGYLSPYISSVTSALQETTLTAETNLRALEDRNRELELQLKKLRLDNRLLQQRLVRLEGEKTHKAVPASARQASHAWWKGLIAVLLLLGVGYYWRRRRPELIDSPEVPRDESVEQETTASKTETPPWLDMPKLSIEQEQQPIVAADLFQEQQVAPSTSSDPVSLVKSREALETLLELAKTYISRHDFLAARQALAEVTTYGNEEQQTQAVALLERCKHR